MPRKSGSDRRRTRPRRDEGAADNGTKTLYLLRHAKAERSVPPLGDVARRLSRQGCADARRLGATMGRTGLAPALVLCSAARRAQESWALAAAAFADHVPVRVLRGLYQATPEGILAALARVPDSVPSVLIVAHNPALEELALELAGPGSNKTALARLRRGFPAGALAAFEGEARHWRGFAGARPRLLRFLRPDEGPQPRTAGQRAS